LNAEVASGKGWDLSADVAVLKGAFHFESHIGAGGNFGCRLGG